MVQQVELPFGALNVLPGVSGVEDVEFEVPEVADIDDIVADAVPDIDDIVDAFEGPLDDVVREITREIPDVDDIGDAVADQLDITVDIGADLADAVVDQLTDALEVPDLADLQVDIEGSLFSLQDDFVALIANALDEADLSDVGQFPDLAALREQVREVVLDVLADVLDGRESLIEWAEDNVEDIIDQLPHGDVLLDLDAAVDRQIERIGDRLVDDDVADRLHEVVEEYD